MRSLSLLLVIIILSIINVSSLWRLGLIIRLAMWIIVISSSCWFSRTELWIALIKLFSHRFVYRLSNCTVIFVSSKFILTHEVMIIHIFLYASRGSIWVFNIACVYFLDLFYISFYHIEISRFKLFCFLEKTCLLNVS